MRNKVRANSSILNSNDQEQIPTGTNMIQDFGRRSTDYKPNALARNSHTGQRAEFTTYNQNSRVQ